MSGRDNYHGNDPTGEMEDGAKEGVDLKVIRKGMELQRQTQEILQRSLLTSDNFQREFEQVATAAQDWTAATVGERFRALRILVRRFGPDNTYLLAQLAAPSSMQNWALTVKRRSAAQKLDQGKRDKQREQRHLDYLVGTEVYLRMKAGQSKSDSIAAVKEDFLREKPYPSDGLFPPINRPSLRLPDEDAIEKWLNRFRRDARNRGSVDPYSASSLFAGSTKPDLNISDIPKRGRPRKK